MSKDRMSLKEAAELLGIKPNSVRSRWKKGDLEGDRDNSGKIWVWVDREAVANDKGSKKTPSKPSIEPFESKEIKALEAHLKATQEQLAKAEAEIADLRPQAMEAVKLKTEIEGLRDQQGRGDAEIERLHKAMDALDAERRELVAEVLRSKRGLWERIFGSKG